jgi:uncharacterized protein YfiM (DUF2279 family)
MLLTRETRGWFVATQAQANSYAGICFGDVSAAGGSAFQVDVQDVMAVLNAFGNTATGDVDGDGDTDTEDLLAVLSFFGNTCTPPDCLIADIYISEAHGSGSPSDFLEITNGGSAACSMLGAKFDDSPAMSDLTFGNVVIAAGASWVGLKNTDFSSGLSDGGETLYLCDATGACESVTFGCTDPMSNGGAAVCFSPTGTACYCTATPGNFSTNVGVTNAACGTGTALCAAPPPVGACDTTSATATICTKSAISISEAHGTGGNVPGSPADYIELYNAGPACSLMCWQLDDNPAQTDLIFGDVIIPAQGYWLGYRHGAQASASDIATALAAGIQLAAGDNVSFGSGISGSSEQLHLCTDARNPGDCYDYVDMGATPSNDDAQCFTAGGVGCYCLPSPGFSNAACRTGALRSCTLTDVHISEAHGKGAPADYIEITNGAATACSMGNFTLDDSASMSDLTFSDNIGILPGKAWVGYRRAVGSFSSGLSSDGETLHLCDPSNNCENATFGCTIDNGPAACMDVSGTACYCDPNPGNATNNPCWPTNFGSTCPSAPSCLIADIYISEAHGSGSPSDFLEITNGGSAACSMLGAKFDDSPAMSDLTFGNVVIAAGASWVGLKNTDFSSGLSDGGETLYLCDATGACESVTFGCTDPMSNGGAAVCFSPTGTACYCTATPGNFSTNVGVTNAACGTGTALCAAPPPVGACDTTSATATICTKSAISISEAHGTGGNVPGSPADYIELYNAGPACSLMCWQLDDNPAQTDLIFGDVIIPAQGYWLGYRHGAQASASDIATALAAGIQLAAGDNVSFGSGISGSSEQLHLCTDARNPGDCYDYVDMGATPSNDDAQCFTAGGVGCYCLPSPGFSNAACRTGALRSCTLTDVHISEAHGKGAPADYIEITNGAATACSMGNFTLDDSASMSDLTFSDNIGILPGKAWVGYRRAVGSFSSGLSSDGETLHLCDPSNNCENATFGCTETAGPAQCLTSTGTSCYCNPNPGNATNNACITTTQPCQIATGR